MRLMAEYLLKYGHTFGHGKPIRLFIGVQTLRSTACLLVKVLVRVCLKDWHDDD